MAIALNELDGMALPQQAAALGLVAVAITVAVYGVVGLIVKLDDIGLHLADRANAASRAIGRALVRVVPKLLKSLSVIGTAAMLWVGGGILLHGMEELGAPAIPHMVHDAAHSVAEAVGGGSIGAALEWIANAIGAAIAGGIVGGIIVLVVKQFHKKPDDQVAEGH
jgi:hypothetical protein